MVTRLKAADKPEPWQSSRKGVSETSVGKTISKKVGAPEESVTIDGQPESKRRGRPSLKSTSKAVPSPKGRKKTKRLPASALNEFLGVSKSSVADVEELRRKREQDAEACGRAVRTISPYFNRGCSPTTPLKLTVQGDRVSDAPRECASRSHLSPLKCSQNIPLPEDSNGQDEMVFPLLDEEGGKAEPTMSRRVGKEPIAEDVQEAIPPQFKQNGNHLRRQYVQIESDRDSQSWEGGHGGGEGKHDSELIRKYWDQISYGGSQIQPSESTDAGIQSKHHGMEKYVSMKPKRNFSRGSVLSKSRSHHRWQSQGPVRRRGGHLQSNGKDFEECYECPSSHCFEEKNQNSWDFYGTGRPRSRHSLSSSPESLHKHRRRHSIKRGRSSHRQSTTSYSSMSPPRRSITSRDDVTTQRTDIAHVKARGIAETSAASDRRRRRHQQALLDTQKTKRQGNGNKPFYLMLDREGRPYGIGKPSWIAEINKLAIGLDPSCMNIRKQTFQDVQTLKNRLDDKFEYSGTLNEDYLRALMGKAVTKRRSELISLIKNNGSQPEYIDKQVWIRLQKLATSKQREEKSEQGRYANACRKTLGRTGCRGVDGVREKLRSLLGRSPDPSEVEEEMHRDKGYGGQRRKKQIFPLKEEKKSNEFHLLDESRRSQRSRRYSDEVHSDSSYDEPYERQLMVIDESRGRSKRNSLPEEGEPAGRIDIGQQSLNVTETNNMSNEEYIRKLEAEIQLLRQRNAKAPWSNGNLPSQSAMYTGNEKRS